MDDEPIQPFRTSETDRLWVEPRAVLARYGEQGDAVRSGPSVFEFRRPAIDWYGYALDNLPWTGNEAVLDAGCGRGAYLPHLAKRLGPVGRLVGLDFSPAMLRRAKEQTSIVSLINGDVQHLPFAGQSFDVVLTAHMLYHVPDIRAAIAEFQRVLHPDGVLMIIIGSARDKERLDELFVSAGGAFPLLRYHERFTADRVPDYLRGIFGRVERRQGASDLVITDPEALVNYFFSLRTIAEAALRPGMSWDSFCREAERMAVDEIGRKGAFLVPEENVVFLCRS